MLDAKTCKAVLNSTGGNYSDAEVEQIATLLWRLAQLTVETYHNTQSENNQKHVVRDEKSNPEL